MKQVAGSPIPDRVEELLVPSRTALLVVDMQNDFCDADGHFARHGRDVSRTARLVPGIAQLIDAARATGVRVVYTQQITAAGFASDTPAWLYFKTRDGKSPDYTMEGSWGAELVPGLTPRDDEPVVVKHRPSAFHRTDLEDVLRARGVETVVVAGCITQGCVQATVTDASYHDFFAVVVGDLVDSTSAELHENALRFLRSRYDVIAGAEIAAIWRSHPR